MNERIRELAEQAGCSIDGMGYGEGNVEKFAELIVSETITEMCQQLYWHGEDQSNNPKFYKAIEKTKNQFGVYQ